MLTRLIAERRARSRAVRPDAGITLVELVVTMSLMSIVGALALNWLLGATSASNQATNSSFATSGARTVLASWPALLRVADAPLASAALSAVTPVSGAGTSAGRFVSITPTSISFNADLNNRPACTTACTRTATTLVQLSIVPVTVGGTATSKLVQTLTQPDGTTSSMTFVASGAGRIPSATSGSGFGCLFTAYDSNGVPLNPACSSTTPLASIARVDLAFTVTPSDGSTIGGATQTFQTSVQITGTVTPVVAATAVSP